MDETGARVPDQAIVRAPGSSIHFVDTTLRDGQMSLWATRMKTEMMAPILRDIDAARYVAAEIIGSGFFKKCVRDLRENPWDRIRLARKLMPQTPLRAIHTRHATAFQVTPAAIYALWTTRLAANGVQQLRISDPSNTPASWERNLRTADAAGLDVVINLVYSASPRHTDEYYAERARAANALPAKAICLKDPGGLLTPDRMRSLVPAIRREVGDTPLEFHGHCNNGLGPVNALEAIRMGIPTIHTAIPPLANGASLPSVFGVAANATALGYPVDVHLEALERVVAHFAEIATRYRLPVGSPAEYDERYYGHQLPGGMVSNLEHQLDRAGMLSQLPAVLEETARVRADLGYPIMVTPYSQFVGIQAATNVLAGERYANVVDEVIQYALGWWGEEERDAIDPEVRDKILDRPRASELDRAERIEPTLADLRRQLDADNLDDDDFLLRYFAGDVPSEAEQSTAGWGELIRRLGHAKGYRAVRVFKGETMLYVERRDTGNAT